MKLKMAKAIVKLNGGQAAILCSCCSKIIKTGDNFTDKEWDYTVGLRKYLEPYYCNECTNKSKEGRNENGE